MKKIIVFVFGIIFIVAAALYLSDPHFWDRYLSATKAKILKQSRGQWYSPLAEVSSQQGAALATREALPKKFEAALKQTEDYVANRNSSSFLVWHDGAVVKQAYFGDTNKESLIVSKSLAKPLAAMTVARAIEQGHIRSLDQPVADFIQEWKDTEKQDISIRHLLNMTSGLERFYRVTNNPFSSFHRAFLSGKHEDIIINDLPLQEPPGTYYDYSQATSDLIAVLIQRATNENYENYIATELLSPIGAAGGTIWLNREGGVAHSGCCIMLPADTWLRLGVLLAQDGVWNGQRVLPDWWNQEVFKGSATNPNFGLYFWLGSPHTPRRHFIDPEHLPGPGVLQSEPYAAQDVLMFDGNGSQVIYIVPSKQLVAVRTGGWPGKDTQGQEWDNTYIPNLLIKALDEKASTEQPKGFSSFSTALQEREPLGKVAGAFSQLFEQATQNANGKLAAAVDHAKEMDSYGLLVWHQGQLVLEEYFGDFDANLRSETASMHKSVLALLFAAALEDGFIKSLQEPVGNYIQQWQGAPEGKITIAQLLNMSSGLKPLSSEGGASSPRNQFYTDGENVRKIALGMRQEVEPGSRFLYANTNSQVLAIVIEAATKMPYAEYLSKRLWQPLGAEDAYVWHNESEPPGFPRTYSSLLARPRDWLRIGLMIKDKGSLNGKKILKPGSIDELTESSPANPNYAKHIWLGKEYKAKRFYNDKNEGFSFSSKEPFIAKDMIYFDGIGGQRVYISRAQDLVVVRVGDLRMDWDDTHLPNLVIKALSQ